MESQNSTGLLDRRKTKRIDNPFPAIVEGTDVDGSIFQISTALDNLSREGLYLRMVPCVEVGATLLVVFRLSGSVAAEKTTARVKIKGKVLRVDKKDGGACGVAIGFKPVRIINPTP